MYSSQARLWSNSWFWSCWSASRGVSWKSPWDSIRAEVRRRSVTWCPSAKVRKVRQSDSVGFFFLLDCFCFFVFLFYFYIFTTIRCCFHLIVFTFLSVSFYPGVAVAMGYICFLNVICYSPIQSRCLFYMYWSLPESDQLPWKRCISANDSLCLTDDKKLGLCTECKTVGVDLRVPAESFYLWVDIGNKIMTCVKLLYCSKPYVSALL